MEDAPRHRSVSNGLAARAIRTNGEQLRTLLFDMQNRYKTRITLETTVWPWMVRNAGFCVTRHARGGAGGIITPRAAYDRDYTQEIVPFAKTFLFKVLTPERRGLSSGKKESTNETPCEKGIWFVTSETNPEHIAGTINGAMGARTIRRLEPTKRSETSLLLEIEGPAFGPGTKCTGSWNAQETSDTCTSLTTSPRRPDRRQIRQLTRQHIFVVIISARSE